MKKNLVKVYVALVVLSIVMMSSANAITVLSAEAIDSISKECISIKSALQRTKQADRPLRVGLSRHYESISRRLMSPLNSRIALNSIDGVELAKIKVDFDDKLGNFREKYSDYELSLDSTLGIDCEKNPVEFYNSLVGARTLRAGVNELTVELSDLANNYRTEVVRLADRLEKDK
jgi:hypothetical protein